MQIIDHNTELAILYEILSMPPTLETTESLIEFTLDKLTNIFKNDLTLFYKYQTKTNIFNLHSTLGTTITLPSTISSTSLEPIFHENSDKNEPFFWNQDNSKPLPKFLENQTQIKNSFYLSIETNDGLLGFFYAIRFSESRYSKTEQLLISLFLNKIILSFDNIMAHQKKEEALTLLEEERDKFSSLNQVLKEKNEELKNLTDQLNSNIRTDDLTKLLNRQAIFEFLEREWQTVLRELPRNNPSSSSKSSPQQPNRRRYTSRPRQDMFNNTNCFTVALIDLDHLKEINENHGHNVGDDVLRIIGEVLLKEGVLRRIDLAGRFGGEEFIVIFPGTRDLVALYPIVRLYKALKEKNFSDKNNEPLLITVSIGLSQSLLSDKSVEDVVKRAEKAVQHAKGHGRNQVVINQCNNNFLRFCSNDKIFGGSQT